MNLYHYTDQDGFIGILQDRSLWATKIQYLNDHHEYYLATELASENLKKRVELETKIEIKSLLEACLRSLEKFLYINLCVCSLTEEGDLLSQWRGYSSKMGGYSIGFDFDRIKSIAEENQFELVKCIYDESEQKEQINNLIETVTELKLPDSPPLNNDNVVKFFKGKLLKLAPTFKNNSFSEEKEWRLVGLIGTSNLDFRAGNSMLIPYTTVNLGEKKDLLNLLNQIVIGHTPNVELAKEATKSFLYSSTFQKIDYPIKKTSMFDIRIIGSSIPFRNW